MLRKIWKQFHNHKNNLFGWRTKRRIIVIETDDWGSIRMAGKAAFNNLLEAGILVDKSHYNINDGLESNNDLEGIYNVLSKHKDSTNRHVVLTGVNVVANPDFEKIEENNFSQYFYEPVTFTYKRYGNTHNCVHQLWNEGIEKRLFVPAFHGREHINILRWMKALQNADKNILLSFKNRVTGIPYKEDLQAAFAVDDPRDIVFHRKVIETGLDLFKKLYGYTPRYFVPPNGPFNASSYEFLYQLGIRYINSCKWMVLPDENGKIHKDFRYNGMKNKYLQYYLIRNCFFEPSSFMQSPAYDWVGSCLKEVETAFFWHKPAIISSHRVNYIGWINPANRDRGLALLDELLNRLIKLWPDVEFMTSVELGDLISE
ncbi:MAG: hypothetical protein BWY38_02899 [Ignavibacteria bacterium ADurb.Bin266]|nr:MAG: hypothetical protein BWY38_02899 [Ignavibacteria bacterium ADurb.Bin266]